MMNLKPLDSPAVTDNRRKGAQRGNLSPARFCKGPVTLAPAPWEQDEKEAQE
jgi:hypothetical protein